MQTKVKLPEVKFSPVALFAHGLAILPAFIFQKVLLFRVFQTGLFIFLSLFPANSSADKRKNLVFDFLSFLFILVFNMFTPEGEVLFKIFYFPITIGALSTGIFKGTVFTGLLALSKITIMKNLALPGFAGKMVNRVFYYFRRLKDVQGKYKNKDIIERIDLILLDVTSTQGVSDPLSMEQKQKTSFPGFFLIILSIIFHWGILVIPAFISI